MQFNLRTQALGLSRLRLITAWARVIGFALGTSLAPAAGRLVAWGDFGAAQAHLPPGLTNVISIAAGGHDNPLFAYDSLSAALTADGTLVVWEWNDWRGWATNVMVRYANAVAVTAGSYIQTLLNDGSLSLLDGDGSLGPLDVGPLLTDVVAISSGKGHTLALKSDGTVVSWEDVSLPQTLPAPVLSNVVAVAAGGSFGPSDVGGRFSLALRADGTVAAWGANGFGQTDVPSGLSNVVAIAAGQSHSLALKADGTVTAWGLQWVPPPGLTNVVAISAAGVLEGGGLSGYSLAMLADGTVKAWGETAAGQLDVPAGLTNVSAISAGEFRCLALLGDGPPGLQAPVNDLKFGLTGFSCTVGSQSGRVYRLEYKNSLVDDAWQALPLVAGSGRVLALKDSTTAQGARYYRVRRW